MKRRERGIERRGREGRTEGGERGMGGQERAGRQIHQKQSSQTTFIVPTSENTNPV